MKSIAKRSKKIWWIMRSTDSKIVHHGCVEKDNVVDSGQDEKETFNSENDWEKRLDELNVSLSEIIN